MSTISDSRNPESHSAFDILGAISFAQGAITLATILTLAMFACMARKVNIRRRTARATFRVADFDKYTADLNPDEQVIINKYCRYILMCEPAGNGPAASSRNMQANDGKLAEKEVTVYEPVHVKFRRALWQNEADLEMAMRDIEEDNVQFIV
ncbi:hypothetical protein BD410DRAFT_533831 [Rickenella mellea]|uniref:Uncharacterized protein n=1 Tax=Rickenella mellea TaxID=50990 RepID=A0A4Y7PQW6_9AGAM|nr:hypothetical protein BD410DRAFT_533831 [Rickenella mellea]